MNRVILIGRLSRDPELRYTPNGHAVCDFNIAVDKRNKDDGANFIDCTAWNKTAENLAKYMVKGRQVGVEGSLEVSTYEKDGKRHWRTTVNAVSVEFLGGGSNTGGQPSNARGQSVERMPNNTSLGANFGTEVQFEDADLPF